jgi:hypothetical protein
VTDGYSVIGPLRELDRFELGDEDLVNAAAVKTLAQGGEVFILPEGAMPSDTPVAAILRY